MGSSAIAAWIAHIAFIVLIVAAWLEVGARAALACVLLWVAGYFLLPYAPFGSGLFAPYVAAIDIALVLMIFKGDVRF